MVVTYYLLAFALNHLSSAVDGDFESQRYVVLTASLFSEGFPKLIVMPALPLASPVLCGSSCLKCDAIVAQNK